MEAAHLTTGEGYRGYKHGNPGVQRGACCRTGAKETPRRGHLSWKPRGAEGRLLQNRGEGDCLEGAPGLETQGCRGVPAVERGERDSLEGAPGLDLEDRQEMGQEEY